jgi:hypothetical protein
MQSGTGFLLCVGTGLGISLFARSGWIWQGLIGGFLIAIANVLFKSDHYKDYCANCRGRETKLESRFLQKFIIPSQGTTEPSLATYLLLAFIQSSFLIFVVAGIVRLIVGK